MLAENEGGASGSATLLGIGVSEERTLLSDAINIRRLVAHHAVIVDAYVAPADVIPPNDEDVRLARRSLGRGGLLACCAGAGCRRVPRLRCGGDQCSPCDDVCR